jgi:hypothetical protein
MQQILLLCGLSQSEETSITRLQGLSGLQTPCTGSQDLCLIMLLQKKLCGELSVAPI